MDHGSVDGHKMCGEHLLPIYFIFKNATENEIILYLSACLTNITYDHIHYLAELYIFARSL